MARAATTTDAFNAVAEPRRREILDALAGGERPVRELVAHLGIAQPQVSKHLRVLREVGLVQVRDAGRQRLYRLDGRPLRPIHDWVAGYASSWEQRFSRLDTVLEEVTALEEMTRLDQMTVLEDPTELGEVTEREDRDGSSDE